MKNFTQKFIGIFALVFTMSFTSNAQGLYGSNVSVSDTTTNSTSTADTNIDITNSTVNNSSSDNTMYTGEGLAQNIPLDLPQGWSMFGYTCIDSVDAMVGFSSISDKIEMVKDEWGLSYLPSWEFNAMGSLHFSEGYQIKMIEEVTGFQFCEAIVPEDGITQADVDAAFDAGASSVTPEDGIGQADVDGAYDAGYSDGASSVTPEDGISQADVDAAVAEVEANFAASLSVGDLYQGGIVFQINEDGTGLVSAQVDLGDDGSPMKFDEKPLDLGLVFHAYEWGCYAESVNGADGISIGTGYQNTLDIVNQECVTESGSISAAQASLDAEISGFSDWYLPSIDELELMYNTIGQGADNSGNFKDENYWSSSKNNYYSLGALSVYFLDGSSDSYYKSNSYRVRVIRAF